MVNIVKVEGFEAFQAKVAELAKTGGDVFVMFSGSKVWKKCCPSKGQTISNLRTAMVIAGVQTVLWRSLLSTSICKRVSQNNLCFVFLNVE